MFIVDDLDWGGNMLAAICYLLAVSFGVVFIALMIFSALYLLTYELLGCIPAVRRKREAAARPPVGIA